MSDLVQRYFDKTVAVRLILGVAACLVAGCLQPSPVSEADTGLIREADTGLIPEVDTGLIPEAPLEIDTSLYQVGDSWVYQTKIKNTEYPHATEISFITSEYVILEKSNMSGKRVDFIMELRSAYENATPKHPDSGKITESREIHSYSQSKWGLTTQWQEHLPDRMLYYEPGQFLDFRFFHGNSRSCLLGEDTLSCKSGRLSQMSSQPCQNGYCRPNIQTGTKWDALIIDGIGLVRARKELSVIIYSEITETRLLSKNGRVISESLTVQEP